MKNLNRTIREIFEEMELYLISSMKRNLKRHELEEVKHGFKYEQWQNAKLRDLERFRRENTKIIDSFTPEIEQVVSRSIKHSFLRARLNIVNFVKGLLGLDPETLPEGAKEVVTSLNDGSIQFPPELEPVMGLKGEALIEKLQEPGMEERWESLPRVQEDNFFRMNDKKMKELIKAHTEELREANSAIVRRMDDVYRETILKAQTYHSSGTMTLNQAIDKATKDFLAKGIDAITYKDGTKVNIASYAEMALRTARHRAYLAAEGDKRQELGITTVLISQHGTACPLCVPWELNILIDDVYSGGKPEDGPYELLSTAMKEGLLHPNCQHNMGTYYEGITSIPKRIDENRTALWYKATQKQRLLERRIRAQKRLVEGTLDEDNLKKEKAKLKAYNKALQEHLKENPQSRRSPEREQTRDIPFDYGKEFDKLEGITTKDGYTISGVSHHSKIRSIERGVSTENITNALKEPVKLGIIKEDSGGNSSKRYIGDKATVVINPKKGNIITVYPTGKSRLK